jgi:hypothetical protein
MDHGGEAVGIAASRWLESWLIESVEVDPVIYLDVIAFRRD